QTGRLIQPSGRPLMMGPGCSSANLRARWFARLDWLRSIGLAPALVARKMHAIEGFTPDNGSVSHPGQELWALENQEKTPARTRILRRLDTLGAVATELARVYREARRGSIASHDTRALVTALKELRA